MDQPPQDPTQPTTPAPPRPITLLSTMAGMIVVLSGLALTAYGGFWAARLLTTPDTSPPTHGIAFLVGSVIIVIGLVELLSGIGILRGTAWGRDIGIISSSLFAAGSLLWAISKAQEADINSALVLGLVFVLYAYSAIALIFRWRRPLTT